MNIVNGISSCRLFAWCLLVSLVFLIMPAYSSFGSDIKKIIEYKDDSTLRGEVWYGNASWYGPKWHGKTTSNGETFNKNKLTAAHRSLPFNTKVVVTNLKNNKSVVVRINDRGPFKPGRIIDLSEEAADKIGSKKEGIAYVKLRVLSEN